MSTKVDTTALTHVELVIPKSTSAACDDEINGEAAAEPVTTPKKTPAKKKATPKKTAQKDGDGGEPTTPEPPKKRTPAKKKEKKTKPEAEAGDAEDAAADEDAPATPVPASSSKKRGAKAHKSEAETPVKKRKTKAATNGDAETPVKTPKGKANKFPESWDEFSEGDKLIVNLRKEGKKWDEVEKAWTNVTGEVPGKDVLRKREAKLRAVAVEFKAGDARKLTEFKAKVEEEAVAALKKLEAEKWVKMVEMFKAFGSEYTSPGLQKKWEMMQKKGEVDASGKYVGNDAEVPDAEAPAEGSEGSADAEVKENGDVDNGGSEGEAEADNEEA